MQQVKFMPKIQNTPFRLIIDHTKNSFKTQFNHTIAAQVLKYAKS